MPGNKSKIIKSEVNSHVQVKCVCGDTTQGGLLLQCFDCFKWTHGECAAVGEPAKDLTFFCQSCQPHMHEESRRMERATCFCPAAPIYGNPGPEEQESSPEPEPIDLQVHISASSNALTTDWSETETAAMRRLVRFHRRVQHDRMEVFFNALPPEDWKTGDPVVSCIARPSAEGQLCDFCITSTDFIRLLEGLAGRPLVDDQKRTARSQLKRFPSVTVGPQGDETARNLHQRINAYGPPMPRYQDKAIKLFPWNVLDAMVLLMVPKWYKPLPRNPLSRRSPTLSLLSEMSEDTVFPCAAASDPPRGRGPLKLHFASSKRNRNYREGEESDLSSVGSEFDVHSPFTDSLAAESPFTAKRKRGRPRKQPQYAEASSADDLEDIDPSAQSSDSQASETLPLEAFLNEQSPGLGTNCRALLEKHGITAQAQFLRFRTVDWWLEFAETRLVGKGLSTNDEFLLKKTVAAYLE